MKPVLTGAAMAAMMLWMLHDRLTAGGDLLGPAALFVAAHVAVGAGLAVGAVRLARRWPVVTDRLRRLHRPVPAHAARMGGAAVLSATAIHLVLHGGLA